MSALEREVAGARRLRRRVVAVALAAAAVGGSLAWAADGSCPNGLPFCFAEDSPARAAEVNQNFAQLKEWLETKVGTVGSASLTASSISAGSLSVTGTTALASTTVTGNATVTGTLSLGSAGSAQFKAMSWCDCELENELVDRSSGAIITAQVPYQYLFESNQAAGVHQCRGGRFLVGLEKTNPGCMTSLGCLEQFKCCRPCNLRAQ